MDSQDRDISLQLQTAEEDVRALRIEVDRLKEELAAPVVRNTRAEQVFFDAEEDGYVMTVATDDGDYKFNVQSIAFELAEHTDKTLGSYRREAEAARASMPARITEEDLDAYSLDDPKRITLERQLREQGGQ